MRNEKGQFVKGDKTGVEALTKWRLNGGKNYGILGKKHSEETKLKMSLSHKGMKHPLFGKKHTLETRIKMKLNHKGMLGRKQSEEMKNKVRGENHYNWTGGSGTLRHQAMSKTEYKLWRAEVFERDNYTCYECGEKGVYLHADHIKDWAKYPELRYKINNGRTLCNYCHYFKTFGKQMPENIKWGVYNQRGGIQI